jgi:hypothetical protein
LLAPDHPHFVNGSSGLVVGAGSVVAGLASTVVELTRSGAVATAGSRGASFRSALCCAFDEHEKNPIAAASAAKSSLVYQKHVSARGPRTMRRSWRFTPGGDISVSYQLDYTQNEKPLVPIDEDSGPKRSRNRS